MDVEMTSSVDVTALEEQIPKIMKFGRRSLRQQVITSSAFIALDAQKNTPAEDVGQIDADLAVTVVGLTKTGRRSKAKNPASRKVTVTKGAPVPIGVLITMARGTPDSKFNRLTGGRWALTDRPGAGPGYKQRIAAWVNNALQKMTMARHSSTHFLQHGWAEPISAFLTDPDYYGGRSKVQSQQSIGNGNGLNFNILGSHTIEQNGDSISVTGANAIGQAGVKELAESHRIAMLEKGTAPLQAAVRKEERSMAAYCEKKMMEAAARELR